MLIYCPKIFSKALPILQGRSKILFGRREHLKHLCGGAFTILNQFSATLEITTHPEVPNMQQKFVGFSLTTVEPCRLECFNKLIIEQNRLLFNLTIHGNLSRSSDFPPNILYPRCFSEQREFRTIERLNQTPRIFYCALL